MRTVQSWTCELGYGADTIFHRTYFLSLVSESHFTAVSVKLSHLTVAVKAAVTEEMMMMISG